MWLTVGEVILAVGDARKTHSSNVYVRWHGMGLGAEQFTKA